MRYYSHRDTDISQAWLLIEVGSFLWYFLVGNVVSDPVKKKSTSRGCLLFIGLLLNSLAGIV
jgi:hypothetical protein